MRSRYRINDETTAHFITSTIVEWLPVFTTAGCCDIVVHSLEYCRQQQQLRINAWAIMDNHFHAIVSGPRLVQTIANLKKFTAQAILDQLRMEGRDWLINQLAYFRAAHKHQSSHQVWQEGVHPQAIRSDQMMLQKLEYLHNNPVKRGFVASPEHWRYSSAHEWRHAITASGSMAVTWRRNRVAKTSAFPNRVWERGRKWDVHNSLSRSTRLCMMPPFENS